MSWCPRLLGGSVSPGRQIVSVNDYSSRVIVAGVGTAMNQCSHDREKMRQLSHATIEQAVVGIFWLDAKGRIHRPNGAACRLLGYDEKETIVLPFFRRIRVKSPNLVERLRRSWHTPFRTKKWEGRNADPRRRKEKSVLRTPMIAYWCYSLVVIWVVTQLRMGKDFLVQRAPWYARKRKTTFSDMLAAARRSHFASGISRDPTQHVAHPKITPPLSLHEPKLIRKAKL